MEDAAQTKGRMLERLVAITARFRGLLAGAALFAICAAGARARDTTSRTAHCAEAKSRYVLFAPLSKEMPAIVLLHGAGGTPEPMVEAWKDLAKKEGIVLIAPELPREVKFEPIAPQIFRCDVEDAQKAVPLDPRRIYVFGHSMGGYLAYDAAMFQSEFFAAVAVHAMGIAEDYRWIVQRAKRKTPIAIYIGLEDPLVSLAGVQKTRDLLREKGFPLRYVEIKNHDHNYAAVADKVNADAWAFFQQHSLPAHGD
jgi:poly(3-hydroxybutyrate) depolymerase